MSGPEHFGMGGTSAPEIPPLVAAPGVGVPSDATVLEHPASRNSSPSEVTLEDETTAVSGLNFRWVLCCRGVADIG